MSTPSNVERIIDLLALEEIDISDVEIPDRIWSLEPDEAFHEILDLIETQS